MLQNLIRAGALALAALGAFGLPTAQAAAPLQIGYVFVTPIGQTGWSYQHDLGRREMLRALGARVETHRVASVAEGADAERVMRDLVRQGNRLIFATSFGYLEPALRVAADHPEVKFEVAGGYKTTANLGTYNARYYEARYLSGLLAGKLSRSGVAGYVAAFPVPEVVQGINAFALGMRAANPKAEVRVVWTESWFDPSRERDAAQTLVDQGADVLANQTASTAVAQVAQASFAGRGVRFIAYQSDMRSFAPDAQLAAVIAQWGGYYTRTAEAVLDGRWQPRQVWGGIAEGMVDLGAIDPKIDPKLRERVAERRQDIVAGRFTPFSAPLVDNGGRVRLAQGRLDDAAIAQMNWLVEGVVGRLPH
jgi:simple sugar transport system substrate-binding protein